MEINIGDKVSVERCFSLQDVKDFAALSGDNNPIHLNEKFAETTVFKKPIVHGFLYGSIISAILANRLPGPGSIYLNQEMKFIAPLYHNEMIKIEVSVEAIKPEKNIYVLSTKGYKNNSELILDGTAVIKLLK